MEETGQVRRRREALRVFGEQPHFFSEKTRDAILSNLVIPGMTPYDVHLAVGAFSFKVIADRSKWPEAANPWDVLWAQSETPDQSEIWLMFESGLQIPDTPDQRFCAHVKGGVVVAVEHVVPPPAPPAEEAPPEEDMTTIIPGSNLPDKAGTPGALPENEIATIIPKSNVPDVPDKVGAPGTPGALPENEISTIIPKSNPQAAP
jgi:hypothetical protein